MKKSRLNPREKIIHTQFTHYGRNAKEWLRKCALLLPSIQKNDIWKKLGFQSLYHYAAAVAGMSRHQAELALWTVRKIQDKPALLSLAQTKGIHAVRPIANVATRETDEFWAEKASAMSKSTLECYVREFRQEFQEGKSCPGTTLQSAKLPSSAPKPVESLPKNQPSESLTLTLPIPLARRLDRLRKRADFEALITQFLDTIEAQEEASQPAAIESNSRPIPTAIRTFALNRTGSRCAFPNCNQRYHQLHHTQRYALEKVHDPGRLVPLCREHNELAHLGLIENEEYVPERWHLRKKADQRSAKWWIDQKVQERRAAAIGTQTLNGS
ncbi:MAG: hypothetical protein ACD_28C00302G0001 [uncultured bacterium]|nr:MAG: hypothetical protein ACD_28C00302G0001 [uncultured bacterium]